MIEAWFRIAEEEDLEPRKVVILGIDKARTNDFGATVYTVQSPETHVKSFAMWYELDIITKSPLC